MRDDARENILEMMLINYYKNLIDDIEYSKEINFEDKSKEYLKGRKTQLDIIYENLTDNFHVDNRELEKLYEKDFLDD